MIKRPLKLKMFEWLLYWVIPFHSQTWRYVNDEIVIPLYDAYMKTSAREVADYIKQSKKRG